MRKIINYIFVFMMIIGFSSCATQRQGNPKWAQDPRIEVVNEKTVVFRDVIKIEIATNNPTQITYVYDKHFKVVKVARGSFEIDLKRGDYLILSDKRITKTLYEVVIE